MVGLQLDVLHISGTGSDVLRRDVPAAERLDEPAVRAEQRLAILPLVVAHDHRLAAAEVDAHDGGLVGHAPGEPQRVRDRLVGRGVLPEARAAERGAQGGVVDGDDAEIAAAGVVREQHLLVAERVHRGQDVQAHFVSR